ncbi:hypothetical protein TVAG_352750 [Trichomonas vaginalis G3]|uniref:Helitron helicase-like domain-containing protein n=1 Tax=Trichomonas vaginalis (strain ATCC PRA-98 / G3) TaxID=412133 RepID=A2EG77_TRIV3|nr:G-quadruplex DNA unwinding [Trichomonas vaginalis G3]EAY08353.1 hypothetical protein TVAG_352750 [Trichomonas vaginalis G3]KAI5546266.1 G-quadruplex DNA unwinding [Trichomonas vaginalis G3]|eukprot:XP_001320576.1 hypothetical protein [Trichomonas vaginalis G3]
MYVPSYFVGSSSYWHKVGEKAFILASVYGPPTFFLTITCNPYWAENIAWNSATSQNQKQKKTLMDNSASISRIYHIKKKKLLSWLKETKLLGEISAYFGRDEYQQRGLPHTHFLLWTDFDVTNIHKLNQIISASFPDNDVVFSNIDKMSDLYALTLKIQVHVCNKNYCLDSNGHCRFQFPYAPSNETVFRNKKFYWMRSPNSQWVVPHCPQILMRFRAHSEIEAIPSDQAIGYMVKYVAKNAESHEISMQDYHKYKGNNYLLNNKLYSYGANLTVPASFCFSYLAGYKQQIISPTVIILSIHLPDERWISTKPNTTEEEAAKKMEASLSTPQIYFNRPHTEECDSLTICEFNSLYYKVTRNEKDDSADENNQLDFKKREKEAVCSLKTVPFANLELFCLRLIFMYFAARSFDDFLSFEGEKFSCYAEVAKKIGLIRDNDRYEISMQEAVNQRRSPAELRFMFALLCKNGGPFNDLLNKFKEQLKDNGQSDESLMKYLGQMFINVHADIPKELNNYPDFPYFYHSPCNFWGKR